MQSTIEYVCGGEIKLKDLEIPTEIEINRQKKPLFIDYVDQRVRKEPEGASEKDIINGGAYKVGVENVTTRRWLDPLVSSEGPYEKVRTDKGWVIRRK